MSSVEQPICPARTSRQPPPRAAPQPPPRAAPRPPPRASPQTPPRAAPQTPPRAAPQTPPRAAPQTPPRATPQTQPRAPSQAPGTTDSVFTYSLQESGQEDWEPYYYYTQEPVTPGHDFSESDYTSTGRAGLERGHVSGGATNPQGATGGDCPFPGSATSPQQTLSPEYSSRQSQMYDSVASSSPGKSRQGIPSVGNPTPSTTPSRPLLGGAFPPSAATANPIGGRDEVFTYSGPLTGQEEWEQYYYYPSPSPGHTKMGSYIQTPTSESLGMKRQRYPRDADPQEAARMDLREFDRTTPSSRIKDRFTATPPGAAPQPAPRAAPQPPPRAAPQPAPRAAPQPPPRGVPQLPPREVPQPSPPSIKDRFTAAPPLSSRAPTMGPMPGQQRRKLSFHYSDINSPNTPASQKDAEDWQPAEDGVLQTPTKLRRLPVMSPSQFEDSSIYRDSPPPSTPQRSSASKKSLERRFSAYRAAPGATLTLPEEECENLEYYAVIGRPLPNIKAISPLPNRGSSRGFFPGQDSPEFHSSPTTFRDNNFEFAEDDLNRSFLQDPSRRSEAFSSGPDRGRSYSTSAVPQSSLEARKAQFKSKVTDTDQAKFSRINLERGDVATCNEVEVLTTGTFANFLKAQEMAIVMFHNSLVNSEEDLQAWARPSPKLPPSMKQTFATVDCAAEAYLCANEAVAMFPFFKIYYKGSLINAVKNLEAISF